MTDNALTGRAKNGTLLPGHSVKSPGRPRGPSASELVRALIEPHREAIIAKAVELAKLGDAASIKLCLERLAPIPRPEDEKVVVPGLKDATTLQAKATAILAAVADGQISATAGTQLLRMIDSYGKTVVLDEHERRLRAIEGKSSQDGSLLPDNTEDEPE